MVDYYIFIIFYYEMMFYLYGIGVFLEFLFKLLVCKCMLLKSGFLIVCCYIIICKFLSFCYLKSVFNKDFLNVFKY